MLCVDGMIVIEVIIPASSFALLPLSLVHEFDPDFELVLFPSEIFFSIEAFFLFLVTSFLDIN